MGWGDLERKGQRRRERLQSCRVMRRGLVQGGVAALTTHREQIKVLASSPGTGTKEEQKRKQGYPSGFVYGVSNYLSLVVKMPLSHPLSFEGTHAQHLHFPSFCFPSEITRA